MKSTEKWPLLGGILCGLLFGGLPPALAVDRSPNVQRSLEPLPAGFVNDPKKVMETFRVMAEPYSSLDSMEYVVEHNTPTDPVYERALWRENGRRFYYEALSVSRPANSDLRRMASFDGERSYVFDSNNSLLTIKNGLPSVAMVAALDSPLMPYQFLKTDDSLLRLFDLRLDSLDLEKLAVRASYLGEQDYEGKSYAVMRIAGAVDRELHEPVTYDVFLDRAQSCFPMLWRSYDSAGILIKEYAVRKVKSLPGSASGAALRYPVEASLWQTKWLGAITGPGGPVKYLGMERDIVFQHVTAGLPNSDDLYTIDPIMADTIYDADAKTSVRVPK